MEGNITGGLPDGSLGTDYETIREAIEKVSLPGVGKINKF